MIKKIFLEKYIQLEILTDIPFYGEPYSIEKNGLKMNYIGSLDQI
jgi:hypothetical protein